MTYRETFDAGRGSSRSTAAGDSPHSVLTDASDPVSTGEAVDIVRAHYGMVAKAARLSGERDDNFKMSGHGGDWMLKIAHLKEREVVTGLQSAILEHLDGSAVRVPRLVRTTRGRAHEWVDAGPAKGRAVRMMTFLQGTPLRNTTVGPLLARRLGRTLADLDGALEGFSHPGTEVALLWDLQRARHTRDLVESCPDTDPSGLLRTQLDWFAEEVAPRLERLPRQLIHNDFSPDNVLVTGTGDPTIGVLDFGDAVVAPRVVDLAVGAAYQVGVGQGTDFFDTALEMIAGYHARAPLLAEEADLLYELIVARHVTAISIASWRAIRFPDNEDYIVRNTAVAWARLRRLLAEDPALVGDWIRRRCELS